MPQEPNSASAFDLKAYDHRILDQSAMQIVDTRSRRARVSLAGTAAHRDR